MRPQLADRPWVKFTQKPEIQGLVGHFTYILDARGIETRDAFRTWRVAWSASPGVERYADAMYIRMDASRSAIIPARSFAEQEAFEAFGERAESLWKAGQLRDVRFDDDVAGSEGVALRLTAEDLAATWSKQAASSGLSLGRLWSASPAVLLLFANWPYVQSFRSGLIGVGATFYLALLLFWGPVVQPVLAARRARRNYADPGTTACVSHST